MRNYLLVLNILPFVVFGAELSSGRMQLENLIERHIMEAPTYRVSKSANRDLGKGVICQKKSVYAIDASILVADAKADIDEDFNTDVYLSLEDGLFNGAYFKRNGLCVWTGGEGEFLAKNIEVFLNLQINPDGEFADVALRAMQVNGLDVNDIFVFKPLLMLNFSGDAPRMVNRFFEKTYNGIVSWMTQSFIKDRFNGFLNSTIKKIIRDVVDGELEDRNEKP